MTTTTTGTVREQRARLDAWEQRIRENDADYATDEWKARGVERVEVQRAALKRFTNPDDVLPTVRDVAYGGNAAVILTDDQKWAVLWQHRRNLDLGEFKTAIIKAADTADEKNAERLAKGFPALVEGIHRWRHEGAYADTIRALVADF